jgi:chitin disaccharide deacetylase
LMMPPPATPIKAEERFLIVNADDFGLTNGVNRGIIESHERGIVTGASLMVRFPAAEGAAEYARSHPKLSVGLHIDIGEWRCRNGTWERVYQVIDPQDAAAAETEFYRQLRRFEALVGRPPTHLDSHQHAHRSEPLRTLMIKEAEELKIPLRGYTKSIEFRGEFYGQTDEGEAFPEGVSSARLVSLIEAVPCGWTELTCHPGYAHKLESVYSGLREDELRVLCSAEVREALDRSGVQLRSFVDFRAQDKPRRS